MVCIALSPQQGGTGLRNQYTIIILLEQNTCPLRTLTRHHKVQGRDDCALGVHRGTLEGRLYAGAEGETV